MALKRKRSTSELCPSPSASSTTSSSFSFSSPPHAQGAPIFWNTATSRQLFSSPAHLNSRTMKRSRDNRPSEEEVHERTLNLLFSAKAPNVSRHEHSANTINACEEPLESRNNQQSLHRFWNISSAPKPPTNQPTASPLLNVQSVDPSSSCEDCGLNFSDDANGDSAMDVDELYSGAHACATCSKSVCFGCSVSNLGDERRCLRCAGQRWATGTARDYSTAMQM